MRCEPGPDASGTIASSSVANLIKKKEKADTISNKQRDKGKTERTEKKKTRKNK